MTKANTVLATVAAAASFGAAAAQFSATSEPVVVAAELAAGEVGLDFDDDPPFQPTVAMTLERVRVIDYGTTFTVGFHLVNARFARPVAVGDAKWVRIAPGPDAAMLVRRSAADEVDVTKTGGHSNRRSVWFTVKVDQLHGLRDPYYADGAWHGDQRGIDFRLPNLVVSGRDRAPPATGPFDALVRVTVEQPGRFTIGSAIAEGLVDPLCGREPYPGIQEGCVVVRTVNAVAVAANTPGRPVAVSPHAGTGHLLVGADGRPLATQQAVLGELALALGRSPPVRDVDGTVLEDLSGGLAGKLEVTVESEHFRPGDRVYADLDRDGRPDDGETFALAGREAVYAGEASAEPVPIVYVPNGTEPLRHGAAFTTNARIAFDRAGSREAAFPPSTLALHFHGFLPGGARAYAIPPPTSSDTANLRVTCESLATRCRVYLQCRDQEGFGLSGDVGYVATGATRRWSQAQIATVLGGPWAGRLACEVLSDGPVSVQVLTRAAGVLVNNTPVATQASDVRQVPNQ